VRVDVEHRRVGERQNAAAHRRVQPGEHVVVVLDDDDKHISTCVSMISMGCRARATRRTTRFTSQLLR